VTADNGNAGSSDGNVDTVSVIDLKAPVHVIDHATVPDSPEGLAISPRGNLAAAAQALGSNKSKQDWFYHPYGLVTILSVSGDKVTKLHRPGLFHPARQRHQRDRHRQALQGARPSSFRPDEPALANVVSRMWCSA